MRKKCSFIFLFIFLFVTGCADKQSKIIESTQFSYEEPQYKWGNIRGETLTIWSQEPELDRIYMQRAIKNYEKATENTIEVVQLPKLEFQKCVKNALLEKEQAPDMILSYGGTNIEAFHPEENFYDFTNAIWVEDLTDTSINQAIYHGRVIGLPHWEASISGTIYNKELFKKYRVKIPTNQEEFLSACEVFLQNGITPLYLSLKDYSLLLYQFPLDTIVSDTEILSAINKGELNYQDIPEMSQIVKWYKKMFEAGYLGKNPKENTWDGMSEAMQSEQYAMMLCWDTWLYTDFKGDASKFGLMPAFIGIPTEGVFEGPNMGLVMVNKHSKKLEAALDFVTFLSDPYNYNQVFEGVYTAPAFKHQMTSISTPQYVENERLIEQLYYDSTAWLRIQGFSQDDAVCIVEYMTSKTMSLDQCLQEMDQLRQKRKKIKTEERNE